MAGLEPLVVWWNGWCIQSMVVVSFAVQVTLLLLADIRRRKDSAVVKVIIWSAYLLADSAAIYALGHMSVVCRSPEHHLMALWAPLLLVHLGGQDNITAYAVEDNRLWLRHLQTFVLQVAAAGYVMYVSSILSHPSKLRSAAMLMFVVGVLKYGERIWALKCADSCASSSLSATSYSKFSSTDARPAGRLAVDTSQMEDDNEDRSLAIAYSLLDVPKKMFEGPTRYVEITVTGDIKKYDGKQMLGVAKMQLWMMYDLLYTKAAVVHTWYGLCSRVLISLPFTVAALALFRSSSMSHAGNKDAAAAYSSADVAITNVLLTGAVVLETMALLRTMFSKWTAALLFQSKKWYKLGHWVLFVETVVTWTTAILLGTEACWSGNMPQHNFFQLMKFHRHYSSNNIAKMMGREDWWDSMFYSWSTRLPEEEVRCNIFDKVVKLVVHQPTTQARKRTSSSRGLTNVFSSWGEKTLRRRTSTSLACDEALVKRMKKWDLDLDESILAWHIATGVYIQWFRGVFSKENEIAQVIEPTWFNPDYYSKVLTATECLSNYMFFLLAARPYMLPYPISRHKYVQLCHDALTHHLRDCSTEASLLKFIELEPPENGDGPTLHKATQLATKLINGANEDEEKAGHIMEMILDVWVEILCYTAYWCNENSHARNLADGGQIITIVALLMIYRSSGIITLNETDATAATTTSSQVQGATDSTS